MTTCSPVHQHKSCCHTPDHLLTLPKSRSATDKVIRVLEKVSLVAIGVFSAITSLPLFASSLFVGLAIGLWDGKMLSDQPHTHQDHSLCAHGFMEHLTGVKLPAPLALAANIAILVAHIDHHATVFVPIVGVTMGILAGRAAAPMFDNLFHARQISVFKAGCL